MDPQTSREIVLERIMWAWWRSIPGFRSGSRWRIVLAIAGYFFAGFYIILGVVTGDLLAFLFGFLPLLLALIAANVGGIRGRIPLLNCSRQWVQTMSWAGLIVAALLIIGLVAPADDEQPAQGGVDGSATAQTFAQAVTATAADDPSEAPTTETTPSQSTSTPLAQVSESTPVATAVTPPPALTPTPPPAPTSPPTPRPTPTPQPGDDAAFYVAILPVGCHRQPDPGAPLAVQHGQAAALRVDQVIRLPDGVWHHEPEGDCWVRTDPGPVQRFSTLAEAQDAVDGIRSPTVAISELRRIGNLDVMIESARVRFGQGQPGTWAIMLRMQITNRGTGDYEYDLDRSLVVLPWGTSPAQPGDPPGRLTRGRLRRNQAASGYVVFHLDPYAYATTVRFAAIGSTSTGELPLSLFLADDQRLTSGPPPPRPVRNPTFVVNSLPVGCHATPSASGTLIVQHPPGTIQAMDAFMRHPDGLWYREVGQQCWVRTEPGPVQSFPSRAQADSYARTVRPTPAPTTAPPRPVSTSPPQTAPAPAPPVTRNCCRICTTGKACGDSCINRSFNCYRGVGCACDARDLDRPPTSGSLVSVIAADDTTLLMTLEEWGALPLLDENSSGPCPFAEGDLLLDVSSLVP